MWNRTITSITHIWPTAIVKQLDSFQLCWCSSLVANALAPLALLFRFEVDGEVLMPDPTPSRLPPPIAVPAAILPPCGFVELPGGLVRLAMRARTALSHFISSSSLGALRRSERFVSTILNVNCAPSTS